MRVIKPVDFVPFLASWCLHFQFHFCHSKVSLEKKSSIQNEYCRNEVKPRVLTCGKVGFGQNSKLLNQSSGH